MYFTIGELRKQIENLPDSAKIALKLWHGVPKNDIPKNPHEVDTPEYTVHEVVHSSKRTGLDIKFMVGFADVLYIACVAPREILKQ